MTSPLSTLRGRLRRLPRLTVFGRSVVLIGSELAANAVIWVVAGLLFGTKPETRDILSLCLLAWTLGLRHALDADHISAIDNATRGLINLGQLPVTCGLFFSLGHSTIVIVVNVAIAISTDVYDHIGHVGSVGGIVGTAVSASFLFLIGLANSIILYQILKKRRSVHDETADGNYHNHGFIMMRILGPVTRFVNKPWKMYPVGILFGFGFDTASSIALLAISALAKHDANGKPSITGGDIVVLPLLFTAGMTVIDSLDSVLMLYSYAGVTELGFSLFIWPGSARPRPDKSILKPQVTRPPKGDPVVSTDPPALPDFPDIEVQPPDDTSKKSVILVEVDEEAEPSLLDQETENRVERLKRNTMSKLSIILTLMSILVAFSISLIEIMGLIGDNCGPCQDATNDPNGGGLAGSWWRAWDRANDASGYIGAAIVGCFLAIVSGYYIGQYIWSRRRRAVEL